MTTAEKLARLNELRARNGKEPLKAWKKSGAELDKAIEAEDFPINIDDFEAPQEELDAQQPRSVGTAISADEEFSEEEIMEKAEENERQEAAKKEEKPKPKAKKGQTIRAYAEHLLETEPTLKHREVAEKVKKKFPEAQTSAASVAWYASKMKKKAKAKK